MRIKLVAGFLIMLLASFTSSPFLQIAPSGATVAAPTGPAVSTDIETTSERIAPDPASAARVPASTVAESEAAAKGVADRRELLAAKATGTGRDDAPTGDAAEALPPEAQVGAGINAAQVTRNLENTVASSVGNTLAEPAAAADGPNVLYSGNTYVSRSTNAGGSWVQEAIPGGPPDAPIVCCDPDAVYSPVTDTTFNILLYTNAAQTNGVVRIWVRDGDLHTVDCMYTIDPAGAADDFVPDYPHLAVSDNYLYLSSNNVGATWFGAQMRRFPLADISTCAAVSIDVSTYTGVVGQRIHTPVDGATTTMYWGQMDNTTTFRLFSWPEAAAAPTETTQAVNASAFANPDCRGGVGNFDFIERPTSWSITGFRLRGATGGGKVTFLWPSSAVGGATQAHLRGLTLNTAGLGVLAQPVVFNNTLCISYPALSSNINGDLGLSMAAGGVAGGGGSAAQGYIAVDDSTSAGVTFPTLFLTAAGTHNRSDDRFGDYFTVRRSSRCANTWVATNYSLDGGNTLPAHVNARYLEFQSDTLPACPAPK
jgi:hypothetical protein